MFELASLILEEIIGNNEVHNYEDIIEIYKNYSLYAISGKLIY